MDGTLCSTIGKISSKILWQTFDEKSLAEVLEEFLKEFLKKALKEFSENFFEKNSGDFLRESSEKLIKESSFTFWRDLCKNFLGIQDGILVETIERTQTSEGILGEISDKCREGFLETFLKETLDLIIFFLKKNSKKFQNKTFLKQYREKVLLKLSVESTRKFLQESSANYGINFRWNLLEKLLQIFFSEIADTLIFWRHRLSYPLNKLSEDAILRIPRVFDCIFSNKP